jgi:TUG ubiquitin-like domain
VARDLVLPRHDVADLTGKKYKVQATTMQPVGVLVDQICDQLGNKFDRSSCTLLNGKQQLDLNLPIRFANLPKGVVLKLESGASLPIAHAFAHSLLELLHH